MDPKQDRQSPAIKRPPPQNKRVVANLSREMNGENKDALTSTFGWIDAQITQRDRSGIKPLVVLMDGQLSLWEEAKRRFGGESTVEILDLLHVTSRLWDAAHVFHSDNCQSQIAFMKDRVLRTLKGEIKTVISGLRQMATKQKISRSKAKTLEKACRYLEKNGHRMRYDEYLQKGYPIASGVIEGACRHFVKDRMERAGMRWSIEGAQAMLDVRSTFLNGDWNAFVQYRINKEITKLYPHRHKIKKIDWPLAA